jgi:hypothetical protein
MRIFNRFINYNYLNSLLLALILTIGLVTSKVESTSAMCAAQNSFSTIEMFSKKDTKISFKKPTKENKEDKKEKENLINLEEEVDFLDNYQLPILSIYTPINKIQTKIIQQEKYIELFHPELLVPPPKA